jgi:hypothetical protein
MIFLMRASFCEKGDSIEFARLKWYRTFTNKFDVSEVV